MKNKVWENEAVIVWQDKDIQYLQFNKLLTYPELEHCYTLRSNELINFVYIEGNPQVQEKSKELIANCLKLDSSKFVKPHQTHTDRVELVDSADNKFEEVDGVITDKSDIVLCTTSADCTSLLFYDTVKKVIGDVHSGWRGTIQKIGQKAVQKMIDEYGSNPKDIICCICPHIRKCHFEVEDDVMQMFKDTFSYLDNSNNFITKGEIIEGVQKYYIDTTSINVQLLEEVGLRKENIIDSGICTVCSSKDFHSYRVDKEESGRNAAIICKRANY